MPFGIKSYGAYIPARRIARETIARALAWSYPPSGAPKGERSFASWDEDSLTMAVEAGRDCLKAAPTADVCALDLASTTAPYADLQNAVVVAYAMALSSQISCSDRGGSTRAGLAAVSEACSSTREGDRLVIASDKRAAKPRSPQELQYGSGAAALLIGSGDDVIAKFLGSQSTSAPFVDHFRQAGQLFDYYWEERWIRDEGVAKIVPEAVSTLLRRLDIPADRISHFGLSGGPPGSDKLVAKVLGIAVEKVIPDLSAKTGDTGTAQAGLLLIEALEHARAGDIVVVAAFAQGCEVIAFEIADAARPRDHRGLAGHLTRRIEESSYLKLLSFDGHVDLDWGMRSETDQKTALTELYRSADQILGFVGGRCSSCETVQFPRLPACVSCGALNSLTPFALANQPARVGTFTADWLMFSPSPPLYIGLVQFDVGARVLMEITDVGPKGIDVGTPLEMRFRIKERDRLRGYDRYFWKAVPVELN